MSLQVYAAELISWVCSNLAQDTEVYYDLKRLLEESGASVPSQLAHHEAILHEHHANRRHRSCPIVASSWR